MLQMEICGSVSSLFATGGLTRGTLLLALLPSATHLAELSDKLKFKRNFGSAIC